MGSHDSIFLDREIEAQELRAKEIQDKLTNLFSGKGYGNESEMRDMEWLIKNKDKILRNRKLIDCLG